MRVGLILCVFSCQLQEVNQNPNNPEDVPIGTLLTSAEVVMSYAIGSDAAQYTGVFTQQIGAVGGDIAAADNYNAGSDRFDVLWTSLYANSGQDLIRIIDKATGLDAPRYSGIAKILLATTLGNLTDLFGDIPYAEAFKGTANISPRYDQQEKVYAEIQKLLDEGIAELAKPGNLKPGSDDIFYRGDVSRWTAAAWSLKARYALHLTKLNPNKAAQEVLNALYAANGAGAYRGITGNDADLQLVFLASATQASPWWQQNALRPGTYALGANFVNLLNGGSGLPPDPRRAFFATPVNINSAAPVYVGTVAGKPVLPASNVGPFYGSQNSPVPLMTFVECKFMEAEARLILDQTDPKAGQLLQQGIVASFAKVGANAVPQAQRDEYLAKQGSFAAGESATDKLNRIITQKYIALFTQPEVWVDYRRTGFPFLIPALGGSTGLNPGGAIPRRFPYPLNAEQAINQNIPTQTPSYQVPRLWWDK